MQEITSLSAVWPYSVFKAYRNAVSMSKRTMTFGDFSHQSILTLLHAFKWQLRCHSRNFVTRAHCFVIASRPLWRDRSRTSTEDVHDKLGDFWDRAGSRLSPSQWETSLQSNTFSHWLGARLESALWDKKKPCQHAIIVKTRPGSWTFQHVYRGVSFQPITWQFIQKFIQVNNQQKVTTVDYWSIVFRNQR